MKINVVDSIMGSGKTSWAINKMNYDDNKKYVYITPYLSEVKRIKDNITTRRFYDPKNFGEGKQEGLHKLLMEGKNIVSTHSLFRLSNEITKELIKSDNYVLILDEVMDVLEEVRLKNDDIKLLLDNDIIRVDANNNNLVIWNEEKIELDTQYNNLKQMCLNKNVFMVNNTLLMWTFPIDVFEAFSEVYVLTYMFDGQIQRYYYDLYNIDYKYYSIGLFDEDDDSSYYLCDYNTDYNMEDIKNKINILVDDKLNSIGDDNYSLSSSWFDKPKNKPLIEKMRKNLENYFGHKIKGKGKDNMWTTFKNKSSKLQGRGYTKGFVPLNSRATNSYMNKCNLAYVANRFINPIMKGFFTERNVRVNENMFALSEMLQWIWRSRIRQGESINIYVPSKRMRRLLLDWLNGKEIK